MLLTKPQFVYILGLRLVDHEHTNTQFFSDTLISSLLSLQYMLYFLILQLLFEHMHIKIPISCATLLLRLTPVSIVRVFFFSFFLS